MTHWIFGYGSLICPDSRARTGLTGDGLPAFVQGLQRHWSVAVDYADITVLGVREGPGTAETGGVLFPLDDDAFASFDARETEYDRISLHPGRLRPVIQNQPMPKENLWVYLPRVLDSLHPIPQTYLDVTLRGCFTVGAAFAEHFLNYTYSWKPRLDDRTAPIYPRPLKAEHRTVLPQVDDLLVRHGL